MFLFANDCVDRVSLHPTSAFLCTCFAFVLSLIKTKSTLNNFLTQKQKVISQNRIELFQNCDLLQFWFPVSLAKNACLHTHSVCTISWCYKESGFIGKKGQLKFSCQKKELTELFLLNSRGQEQKLCLEKIKNWKKQKSLKKSEIHAHLRADWNQDIIKRQSISKIRFSPPKSPS